ncbi:GEVED domain-containing protein [Hwangdonia lutea]|uniref:exo-alpha-sialidase n=1 Tax=Hwangdonia lutea TaxID=3075823 RepID=A0AA97HSJ3_9FLAO|nr:GEVED domain-containing protein [Hwangdonia sp. SCSIO 19198]WOD45180.1 GEVED domain-containing protein [Hwangdonia sp. SCSIO 19198]
MMKNYIKTFGIMVALLFASVSYAQYCTPTVPQTASSFINNLQLNSGAVLNRASTNMGYEYITDTEINLISDTAYRFDIGVGDPGLTTHKRVHVWIDMNRDGDFDDAGELTFSWSGANTGSNLGFSNKNIGPVIAEGETRMRVAMVAANGTIGPISPCDSFTGGEVQDYKISIFLTPPPTYCEPTIPVSSTSYINNFKLSTAGTGDGAFINHASSNVGYQNITSTDATLMTDTSFGFNIGVGDPTATTHKRLHVWIDMNRDGDFDDAGELIFSWSGANTGSDLGFSSKNIGPVIDAGLTRMRVALVAADGAISAIGPCDNFTGGEVKDYRVILELPPSGPCYPTSMAASTTSFLDYFKITDVSDGDLLNHVSTNVGYENVTDSNVALNAEKSYRFNFGVGNPSAGANKRVHIWIDKNQDGDFSDAGESVFSWTGANTTEDLQFANKNIGTVDVLGNSTMRIAMRSSNSTIPAIDPCDTFTDGEIIDFSIVVSAAIPLLTALTPEVDIDLFVGDGVPASSNGTPHTYRIPSLVTSTAGNLLAIADARYEDASDVPGDIDMVVRRSTDNGATWGSPITISTDHGGDACTVVDRDTGRIFVFYAYSTVNNIWNSDGDPNSPNTLRSRYVYSDDDGLTWSAPVDLTASLYKPGDRSYWASAGTGIQLRNGTLVIPIGVVRGGNTDSLYGGLIYSTDHGATWNRSATNSFNKFDENTIVELNDGRIMINSRNHYGTGRRLVTYTSDLGTTWEPYTFDTDLIDPICQGNILRYTSTLDGYDKDRILFSNPASTSGRQDGVLRISYDEGQTWAYSKLYQTGFSAYSSLAILPDGKIGLLYESDGYTKIKFKRFSIEDLSDSTDSFNALSVEELSTAINGTKLYPNPVKNILNIRTSGASEVKIYNVVGKLVFDDEVSVERKELDVSHLTNGLYFVKVKNDLGISNFKIIKK